MVTAAQIRNTIQTKIFAPYGKTVTLSSQGTPTDNTRGELLAGNYTTSSIVIVPYDILNNQEDQGPWGDLEIGEQQAAVPYTVTINVGDQLTIESEKWEVKDVVRNYLPDNLVTIVRLSKVVGAEA